MNKKNSKRPPKESSWNAQASHNLEKRLLEAAKQQPQESTPTDTDKTHLQLVSAFAKYKGVIQAWKGVPLHALTVCVDTQDEALAEEIEKCKIYPTDIDCKLSKSDVERMRPTLCNYVFNGTPSTDEILGALSCKAEEPLSVKDVRYLAFFLEMLYEKGKICRWWQKAYTEAKVFSWNGKPIEKFSDRLRDAKNDFRNLKTEPNKLRTNQEKRLQAYQDLEML